MRRCTCITLSGISIQMEFSIRIIHPPLLNWVQLKVKGAYRALMERPDSAVALVTGRNRYQEPSCDEAFPTFAQEDLNHLLHSLSTWGIPFELLGVWSFRWQPTMYGCPRSPILLEMGFPQTMWPWCPFRLSPSLLIWIDLISDFRTEAACLS